jgi:hypothetical protein
MEYVPVGKGGGTDGHSTAIVHARGKAFGSARPTYASPSDHQVVVCVRV